MNITSIPLGALRAFDAVARHGSISRAGEALGVTHTAISHQMRVLEAFIGTPLVRRDGRGIRLTEAGTLLADGIAPHLRGLLDVSRRVRESAGRRSLTVGCIPSIASRWLVPNLADFSAAHPDIDLRVMYALAETNLAGSSLDVLVTYTGSGAGSGNGTRLLSRLSRPVASPHLLARTGPLDRPDRIAAAPLLHDETRDAWAAWFRTTGFEGASVRQGPVFQDFNLLASAAIAGHGIALCPVEVFRNEIARGDLVVLSDVATQEADHYVVITRPESEALAGPFVDWLLALVRDSGPGDSGFREPADFGENRASVRIR